MRQGSRGPVPAPVGADRARPDGAQPQWGSGRVPRGPATPCRTRPSAPLRDRFGIVERIEFYAESELAEIVTRSARILKIAIDQDGANEIAKRSRGTPRIANRLLKRVRDFAEQCAGAVVTKEVADSALKRLEVDTRGFDKMDRILLTTIIEKFNGGPVGVETLAAAIHEDRGTVEDVYEPYLLQQGFIMRTPRGREATELAYQYFGGRTKYGRAAAVKQLSFSTNDSEE